MLFDGTGDRFTTPDVPELVLGGGDFTIEAWVRPTASALSGGRVIASNWHGVSASFCSWILYFAAGGKLQLSYGVGGTNTGTPSTTTIAADVWTHVAVCREGNVVSYYINGVKDATTFALVGTLNYYAGEPTVIGALSGGGGSAYIGYIDEFRLTKGVARYDANFTAPTAEFPEASSGGASSVLRFTLESERDGYTSWQMYDTSVQRNGYGLNYGGPYGAQAGFGFLFGQTYGV